MNEEVSALHGNSLLEQAEYLKDAIKYILRRYNNRHLGGSSARGGASFPQPTSVMLVCHSMGGVVGRTMLTLPNYRPGSVNTIFTMATPHIEPPAPFQWELSWIYSKVNRRWREALRPDTLPVPRNPDPVFENVSIVSIAGDNLDMMVSIDYTEISSFVSPAHGFTVFTTAIPGVWAASDHQCILWCNQLVRLLAECMFAVQDATASGRTISLPDRVATLAGRLLSGVVEPRPAQIDRPVPRSDSEAVPVIGSEVRLSAQSPKNQTTFFVPRPMDQEQSALFSLLTDRWRTLCYAAKMQRWQRQTMHPNSSHRSSRWSQGQELVQCL